jgi:hypothetical protein
MQHRVAAESPGRGVFARLGLSFRNLGDVYDPEEEVGFGLPEALRDIHDACVAGSLPTLEVDMFDAMAVDMTAAVRERMKGDDLSPLTECDQAVILLYTCEFPAGDSLYTVPNKMLNIPDRTGVKPFVRYIWLLLRALVKCPVSPCRTVYRGIKNADLTSFYPRGHEFEWHQFSSCSCSVEVQQQFTGSVGLRTMFAIELTSSRGRDISAYSAHQQESEVLLPPNTKFRVSGIFYPGAGLNIVQLIEIPPTDPVVAFDDGLAPNSLPTWKT